MKETQRTALSLAVLCTTAWAFPGSGQTPTIPIRYEPTCRTCTIVMTKVATLGSASESASPFYSPSLARDSRGRFFAIGERRDVVLVYGEDGRLLRTFGRLGQGPGEFAPPGISGLSIGRGDTLYVLDRGLNLSVFSPALTFVRTERMPGAVSGAVILPDGRIVLNTRLGRPKTAGYPFHLVDAKGNVVRSLGEERALLPNEIDPSPEPLVVDPTGRTLWTGSFNYQLREWPLSGERGLWFEVMDVPWLPKLPPPSPRLRTQRSTPQTPSSLRGTIDAMNAHAESLRTAPGAIAASPPAMRIIGVDRNGLLWVQGSYPNPSGNSTVSVLEVIDPRLRQLLVSRPLTIAQSRSLRLLPNQSLAYSTEEESDGFIRVNVWRLELQR